MRPIGAAHPFRSLIALYPSSSSILLRPFFHYVLYPALLFSYIFHYITLSFSCFSLYPESFPNHPLWCCPFFRFILHPALSFTPLYPLSCIVFYPAYPLTCFVSKSGFVLYPALSFFPALNLIPLCHWSCSPSFHSHPYFYLALSFVLIYPLSGFILYPAWSVTLAHPRYTIYTLLYFSNLQVCCFTIYSQHVKYSTVWGKILFAWRTPL